MIREFKRKFKQFVADLKSVKITGVKLKMLKNILFQKKN